MTTHDGYEVTVRNGATPSRTIVLSPVESSEYERFAALTSKLVRVPKEEVDEARKREKG